MTNFKLETYEVILFEALVKSKTLKGSIFLTLTSERILLETKKGVFKKELVLIAEISLDDIKFYNGNLQVSQKGKEVMLQLEKYNIVFIFKNSSEAKKFSNKILDTVTNTTVVERNSKMILDALHTMKDTILNKRR